MYTVQNPNAPGHNFDRSGPISAAVRELISKQVADHGIVVWFDPDGHYSELVGSLARDGLTIARYTGSFFLLRREIEPLLHGDAPPRLIVYVPLDRSATHDALVEAEAAGVAIYPGAHPWPRNTRLSVLAKRVLSGILGDEGAAAIEKQVAAGKLSVADLDYLAAQGEGIASGTVSLIFASTNPGDVALAFLGGDQYDTRLVDKGALSDLAALLGGWFGVDLARATTPAQLRDRLAHHILTTELRVSIGEDVRATPELSAVPAQPSVQEACCALARTWRLRRDLRDSYVAHARRVEQAASPASSQFSLGRLRTTETFPTLEEALQRSVEAALVKSATEDLVALAQTRQSSFWSDALPDVQARWALIATAGLVLLEADRVAAALKNASPDAATILQSYTAGAAPWCLLDTHHRHLERRIQAFDFDLGDRHEQLQQLIARARQRYMEIGSDLAERFVRAYREMGFEVPGVSQQRETFRTWVAPALHQGKTAYVLVDALRFEMARELVHSLGDRFDSQLHVALGTVPSITEVGMAALMPGAETGLSLVQVGSSKLAVAIEGVVLKDRRDRIAFLKERVAAKVFDATLADVLTLKKAVRTGIEAADLVLLTSREIDALCEGDNVPLARRTMDDTLRDLQRAFGVLTDLGVRTFVVTADHGYLFGDELESDMKIDPPGGVTADLHRRVWVGHGGAASPSYLRARSVDFREEGDLEIAAPWNFACFKVQGGARAYFHGGLAPQEICIPVAILTAQAGPAVAPTAIEWMLSPGSKRITTRFFSVQVAGRAAGLFTMPAPKVHIEIRDRKGVVSQPVSASYGFDEATGDVQLRWQDSGERALEPNTVTLMLLSEPSTPTATVYLIDVSEDRELVRLGPIDVVVAL
jgi:hypothetical protein